MEIFKIYIVVILFVITILLILLLGGIGILQDEIKKQSKPDDSIGFDLMFKLMEMSDKYSKKED